MKMCSMCGQPHASEESESLPAQEGEPVGENPKLDVLRELIAEMSGAAGKKLASGGAALRPLPKAPSPPEAEPKPKSQHVAWEDDDEDVSDLKARFSKLKKA